jgi:predicted MFS family arabinose efflux permease
VSTSAAPDEAGRPETAAAPPRARYGRVLGVAEFRVIFVANIASMLGSVVASVALTVLVYQQTRSPALAASVMALSFLPYLVGGVLFGAAADRLPPRRVLVACEVLSGGLVACMVIPGMPLPALLVLLFGTGLVSPVFQSVRSAVLADVLPPGPDYILGRSLMRMVAQGAQVAGYGAGGLLLAVMSPRGALTIDAVALAASGLVLRFGMAARPAAAPERPQGSMARDSLAGLRAAFSHRPTRRVMLFSWLVPACAVAPEALAAPYAAHIGQPTRVAGYLLTAIPVGTIVADVIVARFLPTRLQRAAIAPAALLSFAPLAGFAVSPRLGLALALLVVAGLGSAWAAGIDGALLDATPPQLRNRALALSTTGLMFTQGAGFALWGVVGQYVPLPVTIPLAAVAGTVVVLTLRPASRRWPGRHSHGRAVAGAAAS